MAKIRVVYCIPLRKCFLANIPRAFYNALEVKKEDEKKKIIQAYI